MKRFLFSISLLFLFLAALHSTPVAHADSLLVHLGDSLTIGMYQSGGLADKYKAAGFTPKIPGDGAGGPIGFFGKSVTAVLPAVDANSEDIKQASVIVIALGTNPGGTGYSTTLRLEMQQMISKIQNLNKNAKIYWVNLAATTNFTEYKARDDVINEVAAEKNVTVINWFQKVFPSGNNTDENNWFAGTDGIHLTAGGYQAMADTVVSAIGTSASTTSTASSSASMNMSLGQTGASGSSDCFYTDYNNPDNPEAPPDFCGGGTGSTESNAPLAPAANTPNAISNIAIDLVNAATHFCTDSQDNQGFPYINGGNYTCLKDHIPDSAGQYKDLVYNEIYTSAALVSGHVFQCVGFANAVTAGAFGTSLRLDGGGVNYAGDFQGKDLSNYKWIPKGDNIQVGDMPIWPGVPGHIAVVAHVYDSNNVQLAEANVPGAGLTHFRDVTVSSVGIVGWLRRK